MKRQIKTISLLLCLALLLSLCACGGKEEEPEEEQVVIELADTVSGKTLTAGPAADDIFSLSVDFDDSLNPLRTKSSANLMVAGLVYDNLFEVDVNYNLSSRLVESWECNEEGNFFTIRIKPGIPMHDGTMLTAYDVGYSLQRAMMYSDYYISRLSSVQGVSAYSDTELCISTKYADTGLPYRLTIPVIKQGSILSNAPAGTGAYKFAWSGIVAEPEPTPEPSDAPEEGAEPTPTPSPTPEPEILPDSLVAFDQYTTERPGEAEGEVVTSTGGQPLETIYLRSYTDPATTIDEYESALVDLVVNDPTGIYNMGYGGMNEKRVYPTTHMHYLGFNGYSNFLCYANYRRALQYIVDRNYICEDILDGNAVPAVFPINPACSLYNKTLADTVHYDPERCLMELGCTDLDGDGDLDFSLSGSRVEIDLVCIVCSDNANKVVAARKIVEDLQALGMPITLRELSWKDYKYLLENPRDEETGKAVWDMYYDEVALPADWDLMPFFEEVVENEDDIPINLRLNYGRWKLDSVLAAVTNYMIAPELKRQEACNAMCEELLNTSPIIPVCFEERVVISHLGVIRGLNPNQYNVFTGITDWTINLDSGE